MLEHVTWNALDVLNVVEGAELVSIERDRYLCVWDGGWAIEVYDLRDSTMTRQVIPITIRGPKNRVYVHDAIDDYFEELDGWNEEKDLTTQVIGAIVDVE
tara:strand:+ start:253 stop:552 length:300 start_codon:yes stop_codon:yes gene_type:complete